MRYKLTDYEWVAIKPLLLQEPRAAGAEDCRGHTGWPAASGDDAGGADAAVCRGVDRAAAVEFLLYG